MPNHSNEIYGFGPVQDFVCPAIHDAAELANLERQLKRPHGAGATPAPNNGSQRVEPGDVTKDEPPVSP